MAKPAKFPISKHATGMWCFFVSAKHSDSGKAKRRYFKTKTQAEEARRALLDSIDRFGVNSRPLSLDETSAIRALEDRLRPFGVTFEEVVLDWIRDRNLTKSKPVSEIVEEYLEQFAGRSRKYELSVRRNCQHLSDKFGDIEADKLMPRDFEIWLESIAKTPYTFIAALRELKAVFAWAKRMRLASINPIDNVRAKKLPSVVPEVLKISQAREALRACRDLRKESRLPGYAACDATDARLSIAILLFAGVRPEELTRLSWENVFLEKRILKIPAAASKTRTMRNIHIEENLLLFFQETPEAQRVGKIIPSNWSRKWQAIRKVAGISEMQDVCRHSYASYWLAKNGDMNGLLANMGHTTSQVTLKHYLTAAEKPEAEKFWTIMPEKLERCSER